MSILDNFLTGNLSDLPSDTQNTQSGMPPKSEAHHKHHHKAAHGAQTYNCIPSRQKNARDFLAGNTPGVMAFYAPEEQCRATQHPNPQPANIIANTRPDNATVEDAETVQRLVEWREEAIY